LYGDFVWARRALNRQKRRFPARAVPLDAQAKNNVDKLQGYFEWAKADKRIAGFNPWHCPGPPGAIPERSDVLSARSFPHRKSSFYGGFVRARRGFNGSFRCFPARPGSRDARKPPERAAMRYDPSVPTRGVHTPLAFPTVNRFSTVRLYGAQAIQATNLCPIHSQAPQAYRPKW
jgi:hypothetical protein